MKTDVTWLEAVKMANTGAMVWDVVGPLLQDAMQNDRPTISITDLKEKSAALGRDISDLDAAIAERRARDADED